MANTVIRLVTAQTRDILPLEPRGAGTYLVDLLIEGNSLLSTVFVKSISGSVKVNYHESTTGRDFSERKELQGHPLIGAANAADPSKITITPFHNSPQCEIIVTGTAEFSVYATVVNTFASDLDAALQFDGETWQPTVDKGLPAMCLDEASGLLNFFRCKDGGVTVTPPEGIGTPFYERGQITVVPGSTQTMVSFTVPVGVTRKIHKVHLVASNDAYFSLESGSTEIASGIIDNTNRNISFIFDPPRPIVAGVFVELKYLSESEPSLGCLATGFISGNDFT